MSDTKGVLESLKLKRHCEMCGATNKKPKSVLEHHKDEFQLEPAFNPSGQPMTLCRDCRIGSAELLADARTKMLAALKRAEKLIARDCTDGKTLSLIRTAIKACGLPEPYVLITVYGGVADIAINGSRIDVDILDFDNLKDATPGNVSLSYREWDYLKENDPKRFAELKGKCDCGDRSWYGPGHDSACPLYEREEA